MEFHPVVVEQARGFLREVLDISVDDAYDLLRRYAATPRPTMRN
jgi:AmiR/NasT family two-component response regulator